jgi:DNA-binding NtrC family response regulator/HAMP domain-containing protein
MTLRKRFFLSFFQFTLVGCLIVAAGYYAVFLWQVRHDFQQHVERAAAIIHDDLRLMQIIYLNQMKQAEPAIRNRLYMLDLWLQSEDLLPMERFDRTKSYYYFFALELVNYFRLVGAQNAAVYDREGVLVGMAQRDPDDPDILSGGVYLPFIEGGVFTQMHPEDRWYVYVEQETDIRAIPTPASVPTIFDDEIPTDGRFEIVSFPDGIFFEYCLPITYNHERFGIVRELRTVSDLDMHRFRRMGDVHVTLMIDGIRRLSSLDAPLDVDLSAIPTAPNIRTTRAAYLSKVGFAGGAFLLIQPRDEERIVLWRLFGVVTGILVLGSAGIAALSWRISRSLARPLEALCQTMDQAHHGGSLSIRADINTARIEEIGRLSRAFNAMAARLQHAWTQERLLRKDAELNAKRHIAMLEHEKNFFCAFLPNGVLSEVNASIRNRWPDLPISFRAFVPSEKIFRQILAINKQTPLIVHQDNKWIEWSITPIILKSGKVCEFFAFGRDITEERQRQQALETQLEDAQQTRFRYGALIGKHPLMQRVYSRISQTAASDISVVLVGETGTGKELVAREIHQRSPRSARAFIEVDCGAISPNLFESAFFGHRKGAFTGAMSHRDGYLIQANGGTLFLDEIENLSLESQQKLLRVIDTLSFRPVGSDRVISVDLRILAATNRDLMRDIADGAFRKDLWYRLQGVQIRLPALRKRKDDLPLLVEHYIRHHPQWREREFLPAEVMTLLFDYDWPGNVRELYRVLDSFFATGDLSIAPDLALSDTARFSLAEQLEQTEKQYIQRVLMACHGNVTEAAKRLGIVRQTLHTKLKKYGLR